MTHAASVPRAREPGYLAAMAHRFQIPCLVALPLAVLIAGCGHDPSSAQCDEISEKCHDESTPLIKECHDLGHDGTPEECDERYDECLEACGG